MVCAKRRGSAAHHENGEFFETIKLHNLVNIGIAIAIG